MRDGYETVLPDLERAYAIQRDWFDAGYDPAAVARAELAWWVARRVPGQDSPEHVGALIAEENALDLRRVARAGACRIRTQSACGQAQDQGGDQADWTTVRDFLRQSFRALHSSVQVDEK